jgi:hypothetical protein
MLGSSKRGLPVTSEEGAGEEMERRCENLTPSAVYIAPVLYEYTREWVKGWDGYLVSLLNLRLFGVPGYRLSRTKCKSFDTKLLHKSSTSTRSRLRRNTGTTKST